MPCRSAALACSGSSSDFLGAPPNPSGDGSGSTDTSTAGERGFAQTARCLDSRGHRQTSTPTASAPEGATLDEEKRYEARELETLEKFPGVTSRSTMLSTTRNQCECPESNRDGITATGT